MPTKSRKSTWLSFSESKQVSYDPKIVEKIVENFYSCAKQFKRPLGQEIFVFASAMLFSVANEAGFDLEEVIELLTTYWDQNQPRTEKNDVCTILN